MPQYSYAYKAGHDQATLTNIETKVTHAPKGKVTPLGSVARKTLNQYITHNGTRKLEWFWGAMSFADFDDLIDELFGDYTTENALLTVDNLARDNTMHRYNVVAHTPIEGTDYTRQANGDVEGLTVHMDIIAEIAIPP
jgi:hypothetical protein